MELQSHHRRRTPSFSAHGRTQHIARDRLRFRARLRVESHPERRRCGGDGGAEEEVEEEDGMGHSYLAVISVCFTLVGRGWIYRTFFFPHNINCKICSIIFKNR